MAVSNTFVGEFWVLFETRSILGNLVNCFHIWTHLDRLDRDKQKEKPICMIIPTYYNRKMGVCFNIKLHKCRKISTLRSEPSTKRHSQKQSDKCEYLLLHYWKTKPLWAALKMTSQITAFQESLWAFFSETPARNRKCSLSSDMRLVVKFTSENCLNEAQTNTQARLPSASSWVHRDNVWVKTDPACTPSWVKPTRTDNNWYFRSSGHWQTHLQRIHLYLATFALTGDISCGFITERQILAFICIDHWSLSTALSSTELHYTSLVLRSVIWSSLFHRSRNTHSHINEVRGLSQLIIFPARAMDILGESQLVVKGWRRWSSKRFSGHRWTEAS